MVITDSLCHLDRVDLAAFGGSMDTLISHANTLDVKQFLCVCINLDNFEAVRSLAENYDSIYASVGVHPTEILEPSDEPSIDALYQHSQHPRIVAIGETGLDYYHIDEHQAEWQRQRFRRHIAVANQSKKPLIIHTRAARRDTIAILKEEKAHGGVMHCFSEDWQMAKQAIECGFYISFSGIVTFKNAVDLQAVAKQVPDEYLLIETDAPYLTPMPYRGKPNTPGYTRFVAEKLAELRNTTIEHIAQVTTDNFQRLFLNNGSLPQH